MPMTLRLPEETGKDVELASQLMGISQTQLVTDAVKTYINTLKNNPDFINAAHRDIVRMLSYLPEGHEKEFLKGRLAES